MQANRNPDTADSLSICPSAFKDVVGCRVGSEKYPHQSDCKDANYPSHLLAADVQLQHNAGDRNEQHAFEYDFGDANKSPSASLNKSQTLGGPHEKLGSLRHERRGWQEKSETYTAAAICMFSPLKRLAR